MFSVKSLDSRSPLCGRLSLNNPLLVPAAIAGGASLIGSLFNRKSSKDTNALNLQIAQDTNAAQERIASENNATQIQMMRENNDWSRNQAIEMFNLENDYNSPVEQNKRLLAAGMNPAAMLGHGGISVGTGDLATPSAAGSTISPSMPNFVTPHMDAPPSVIFGLADQIAKLSSAYNTIQSGNLTGKEISRYDERLDAEIDRLSSEARNLDAESKYRDVMTDLEQTFGKRQRAAALKREYKEIYLLGLKGETEKMQAKLVKWEYKLAKQSYGRNEQEIPLIIQAARENIKLIQEKQNTEKSLQSSNYASVELAKKNARIAELEGDAKEVLNEFVGESTIRDLTLKDLDIIDKVISSGRANNIPNLLDKLINAGVHEELAKEIADGMKRYRSYIDRHNRYQ